LEVPVNCKDLNVKGKLEAAQKLT